MLSDVFGDEFHDVAPGEGEAIEDGFDLIEIIFEPIGTDDIIKVELMHFLMRGQGVNRGGKIPQRGSIEMVDGKLGGHDGSFSAFRIQSETSFRQLGGHFHERQAQTDFSGRFCGEERIEGSSTHRLVHPAPVIANLEG